MKSKKMKPRPNYLSILSDYTQEDFPYSQIYYLVTRDKITTIYLSQGRQITTYMPLQSLEDQLPDSFFLKVSRSTIVAFSMIKKITQDTVVLSNGEVLDISKRRYREVSQAYQNYIKNFKAKKLASILPKNYEDYLKYYRGFDLVPFPAFALEVFLQEDGQDDYVLRYANTSFAKLLKVTDLEEIINHSYKDCPLKIQPHCLSMIKQTSQDGKSRSILITDSNNQSRHVIHCFQSFYGLCACIALTITESDPEQ